MDPVTEQRRFSRVRTRILAVIEVDGREAAHGILRDVSMRGVFVETPDVLNEGTDCTTRIVLEGTTPPIEIRATGQITRAEGAGVAVDFFQLDLDSLQHLRNLVMYNAEDVSLIEDELAGSLGSDPVGAALN